MEKQKIVHPIITSNVIGKENMIGSVRKRNRLSDITNTVSSSRSVRSGAEFQENLKEVVSCSITKDYISQLMEENATLVKAIGDRNKIIELSSMEFQKLRLALEKVNQQNRQLALANSQMLAELNLSKERVKALQHELGCSVAVLRLKNSELNEKEKVNKELCEKISTKEDCKRSQVSTDVSKVPSVSYSIPNELDKNSKLDLDKKKLKEPCEDFKPEGEPSKYAETTTGALICHSTGTSNLVKKSELGNNIAHELDKSSELGNYIAHELDKNSELSLDEKLNKELCEDIRAEGELSKCAQSTTDAMKADSTGVSNLNRRRSMRNRGSTSLSQQVQDEKKKKELHEKTRAEAFRYVGFATDISSLHSISNNVASVPDDESQLHKLNRDVYEKIFSKEQPKSTEAATVASETHSVDTNMTTKPNRKRSLRSQTSCSVNLTHQVEVREKSDKIRRKSSRRSSRNIECEPCESKDYLFDIVDVGNDIPAYSSIDEPLNGMESILLEPSVPSSSFVHCEHGEDGAQNDQNASSKGQTQETRRISVGRPTRKAAEKVSSYKEISLNAKMRR